MTSREKIPCPWLEAAGEKITKWKALAESQLMIRRYSILRDIDTVERIGRHNLVGHHLGHGRREHGLMCFTRGLWSMFTSWSKGGSRLTNVRPVVTP